MFMLALLMMLYPFFICIGVPLLALALEEPPKFRNQGVCTLKNCVRCNKNKEVFKSGVKCFNDLYKNNFKYNRIQEGLEVSNSNSSNEGLFLKLNFSDARPIWSFENLCSDVQNDLLKLNSAASVIVSECAKALKITYLWQKNDELANVWYIFPLLNQGAWQDEQCRVCPELVQVLHSMDSIMTNSLFGNVFISMLPKNSEIAEHRGLTNARLRVHFGIEIPADPETCYMIIDGEKLNWKARECVVLDDSYLHSVNLKNCKEDRIVLVIDIWHPELLDHERQCISQIFPASYN